jgi:hypothetical protein
MGIEKSGISEDQMSVRVIASEGQGQHNLFRDTLFSSQVTSDFEILDSTVKSFRDDPDPQGQKGDLGIVNLNNSQ